MTIFAMTIFAIGLLNIVQRFASVKFNVNVCILFLTDELKSRTIHTHTYSLTAKMQLCTIIVMANMDNGKIISGIAIENEKS